MIWKEFDPAILWSLAVLLLLICVSGMASGAEISLLSLEEDDLKPMRARGSKRDRAVLRLLSGENRMRTAALILNGLANVGIIILANAVIDTFVTVPGAAWEFAVKAGAITFVLLIFCEMIPKIAARRHPARFASAVAVPMLRMDSLLRPFSWVLSKLGGTLGRRQAAPKKNISMDELSDALEITRDQSDEEKKMLEGIVEFVNTEVEEIMHPRLDIVAVNMEAGFDEVRRIITESGFSRIPAYRESIDNIKGILYVKDMLPFLMAGDGFEWRKHLRPVYYVPEHKKIHDLLEEFRTARVHMAIVVDEYGSTLGLLSLEDILEEIVGEITDESDREEDFYRKTGENTYIFEGKAHIYDFLDVAGLDGALFEEVQGNAETLAGLLIEIKRDFLAKGDSIVSHGVKFTVQSVDGHRIDKIKVEILPG